MTDNTDINVGAGATIAADDIGGGVLAQRVKPVWGPDGTGTDVDTDTGLPVTPVPGTAGGWTPASVTALGNTKTAVKAAAGTLGGYMVANLNTTWVYIQVFNAGTGAVTVGTTTPYYVLAIPPTSAANIEFTCGVSHPTAITVAATTTATGSTAPATALTCVFFYN